MIKTENKGKILIWIACVLSFLTALFNITTILALMLNWTSYVAMIDKALSILGTSTQDLNITLTSMELGIIAVIDIFAGIRYFKIALHKISVLRNHSSLILQSVIQTIFASFLAGIFGILAINSITKRRVVPISQEEQIKYFNDYKKKAMGEAITRLKELKAQGAISEEEYYETLNKILEG